MHPDQRNEESDPSDAIRDGSRSIDVVPFDAMTASRDRWDRYHAYRRARCREAWPDDPVPSDQDTEDDERDPNPHGDNVRWIAVDQACIVGSITSCLLRPGAPNFAESARFLYANGAVLGPWRRHGIGTRLLRQVHGLMLRHAKTMLTIGTHESDGHGFLRHIGAGEKTRVIENRLLVGDIDWDTSAKWVAAALAALPGSRFVHHGPRVPKDLYGELSPVLEDLWQDVPLDALEYAPVRVPLSMMDKWERRLDRVGGAEHLIVFRDSDGSIVGISDLTWSRSTPDRVFQMLTGVRRDKRGCGLAKGLKAAMLLEIRNRYPSVSVVITQVGRSNPAMLSINRTLGFKVYRELSAYQIDRDAIGSWLEGAKAADSR